LDQRLDLIRAVEEAALRVLMEEMNEFRCHGGSARGGFTSVMRGKAHRQRLVMVI